MLKLIGVLILILIMCLFKSNENFEQNYFLVSLEHNNEIKIYDLYSNLIDFLPYKNFQNDLREIFKKELKNNVEKEEFIKFIKDYIKIPNSDFNYEKALCEDSSIKNYDIKYQMNKYNNNLLSDGFNDFLYEIYLDSSDTNLFLKNRNNIFNKNICYDNKRNRIPRDVIDSPDLVDQTKLNKYNIQLTPNILEIVIENNNIILYELIKSDNSFVRKTNIPYKIPKNIKIRINISNENAGNLSIDNTYDLKSFRNSILLGKQAFNKLSDNTKDNTLDCTNLEYNYKYNINCNVDTKEECDTNKCNWNWKNNKCSEKQNATFNTNISFIDKFIKEKNCKNLKEEECTLNCQWYNGKCIPHTYDKKPLFSCSNDERIIIQLNKNQALNIGYVYYDLCPTSIEGINIGDMNYFNDNCASTPVMTNVISSYNKCNKHKTKTECDENDCNWTNPPKSINKKHSGKKECLPYNMESYPFNYWLTTGNVVKKQN